VNKVPTSCREYFSSVSAWLVRSPPDGGGECHRSDGNAGVRGSLKGALTYGCIYLVNRRSTRRLCRRSINSTNFRCWELRGVCRVEEQRQGRTVECEAELVRAADWSAAQGGFIRRPTSYSFLSNHGIHLPFVCENRQHRHVTHRHVPQ